MQAGQKSDNPPVEAKSAEKDADGVVTFGQRIDRICEAAQTTWRGGRATMRECKAALDINGRVERSPYSMMTAAVGAGYVLGGGILSPLTAQIVAAGLRIGLRIAAIPMIQREMFACAESAIGGKAQAGSTSREALDTNTDNQRRRCDESENSKES